MSSSWAKKKSVNINQQIIDLSSEIALIQEFCSFVKTFYSLTKCAHPQCNIRRFSKILKQEIVFENNIDEDIRHIFLIRCMANIELFESRLKQNVQMEGIASLLQLICMECYPIQRCICKVCISIFQN